LTFFVYCSFLGLHIELGDCRAYHYDLIFLRDLFALRNEIANELYCYQNRALQRVHWSKVPDLYRNYILPRRPSFYTANQIELHENCFEQFTKRKNSILLFFFLFKKKLSEFVF